MLTRDQVSILRCPSTTEDAEIVQKTWQAISGLRDVAPALQRARKIAVKINAGVNRLVLTDGRQTELTEPAVVEGTIRAIREMTSAEIIVGDAPTHDDAEIIYSALGLRDRLAKYPGVRLLDFNRGALVEVKMPQPWAMFRSYQVPQELTEADAFVSVAKMKAHRSMGCTLSIKNLFGWLPTAVYGEPRTYLHDRLVRLPRVLVDLAAWTRPCLSVVDAIVAANESEWHGSAMRPGVILAGSNSVATDSVGSRVMSFDPDGDYPDHPFFYRRNTVKLAAEFGLGPNHPDRIEILGCSPEEVRQPFHIEPYGGNTARDEQIRHGAACVAIYKERQEELARRYYGRYLALSDGEVLWDGPDLPTMKRLERESGRDWKNAPQLIIRCVPTAEEIENLEWYQAESDRLDLAVAA